MKDVKNFREHQLCPCIDGIIFSTGEIQEINVNVEWGPPVSYRFKLGAKTSIKELKTKQRLFWSDCAILATVIDEKKQIEVIAGESDHGSDGFVAVISKKSNVLKWIAFFTSSNPFSKLIIDNDQILATSTLEVTWVFPIGRPEAVIVWSDGNRPN